MNFTFFGLGAAVIFAPWTIRNFVRTGGDFVPLEKVYYGDSSYYYGGMSWGRGHMAFFDWVSC